MINYHHYHYHKSSTCKPGALHPPTKASRYSVSCGENGSHVLGASPCTGSWAAHVFGTQGLWLLTWGLHGKFSCGPCSSCSVLMPRCVSLCIPDLWYQWSQSLFNFLAVPPIYFHKNPRLHGGAWKCLAIHVAMPTYLRPVRRWWKQHLWHCNWGSWGFLKEYRPFWLLMKILQVNSCWSLNVHNIYIYTTIIYSFMHIRICYSYLQGEGQVCQF